MIRDWIKIGHGNWCLGAAFFYKNLCFINQVDGGDEWLTIKDDYAFESFNFSRIINHGQFKGYIERLLAATREQCIKLGVLILLKICLVKLTYISELKKSIR